MYKQVFDIKTSKITAHFWALPRCCPSKKSWLPRVPPRLLGRHPHRNPFARSRKHLEILWATIWPLWKWRVSPSFTSATPKLQEMQFFCVFILPSGASMWISKTFVTHFSLLNINSEHSVDRFCWWSWRWIFIHLMGERNVKCKLSTKKTTYTNL